MGQGRHSLSTLWWSQRQGASCSRVVKGSPLTGWSGILRRGKDNDDDVDDDDDMDSNCGGVENIVVMKRR